MDFKNMAGVIVGAVISIVLLTTLLIPITNDAADGEMIYTNEGPRMSPLGEDTITITYSNDNWKIGDRDLGFGSFPITQGTVMIFGQTGSNRAGFFYQSDNDTYTRTNVNRTGEYTWVYDGANKTVTSTAIVNEHTYTSSNTYVEEIYYNDPNGDYAWFGAKPTNAYIPDDWSKFNAWSNESEHFYAIIGDIITVDGTEMTEGVTTTIVTEDVSGVIGVKTIESYTLNIEGQEPINCRGYILPYQITAHLVYMDDVGGLLSVIPVLVAVGLIIGVAGTIYLRRQY